MKGSSEPDVEEWMGGTPVLISNRPSLYYEILLWLEKKKEWFFSPEFDPFQDRNGQVIADAIPGHLPIFPIASTSNKSLPGFRAISRGS